MTQLHFLRTGLGWRVIALILAINAGLSVFAAGVQLAVSYERGKAEVLQEFKVIKKGFVHSLETALWRFNFHQIEVLLDGIHAQQNIVFLDLSAATGQQWQRGDADALSDAETVFALYHDPDIGTRQTLGTLSTRVSFDTLRTRLWEQLTTLLLSNFLKTVVASFVMLMLFDWFVARHLRSLAAQIPDRAWLTEGATIALNRKVQQPPDELDQITNALNRAADEISSAYQTLSEANREQAEFTYAISHDLKSPTNTLFMLLEELDYGDRKNLTEDGQQLLQDAHHTTQRMSKLIEDVLRYSKTIGGDPELQEIDLKALIAEVTLDLAAEITKRDAAITVGEFPVILGVPVQIRLLFQNLISNAVKFSDPARKLEISILPAAEPPQNMTTVEVSDTGIGIDPVYHERIFGMFQRLHTESQYPGSGLGLTLCRRIVSNHGGQIDLRSVPGEGTIFSFQLPGKVQKR